MDNLIKHAGIVESLADDYVVVRILQTSACAACKVAGHCNAAESKEKLIDVYDGVGDAESGRRNAEGLRVGEAVTVVTDASTGYHAVVWGFVIPLLLLVTVIFVTMAFTGNEVFSALLGLAAEGPYFWVVYLLRDRIRQRLSFRIES